jgi:hypothetical protein
MKRFTTLIALLALLLAPAHAEPSKIKGLAFVVLAEPKLPSGETVKASLQERLGNSLTIDKMEADDKVILFRIAGGTLAIGLAERPIPNKELEDVCRYAWYWKAACESVSPHKAHLMVTVLDTNLDKIEASLLLTKTLASLMSDSNAIAGYWHGNLQPRDAFLKQSANASRQRLPIMLWINFRLSSDPLKGWTISTRGMRDFDLMEIESKDAPTDGRSLFVLVAGLSEYLISKGPVIKDGETVGDSPALNIRVRHTTSFWNEGQTVYRVVYPKQ